MAVNVGEERNPPIANMYNNNKIIARQFIDFESY